MKKIMFLIVFLLMANSVFALGVSRTIESNKVTLTITGYTNRFGGIISETLPTGYLPTGVQSTTLGVTGSASGKLTGQLYEIAFISDVNPATIVYGISGSGNGAITGSYAYDDGHTGIIGASQLGSGTTCVYDSICDEADSCSGTRNTDGIVCGTNQVCSNGVCVVSQQITCWKKTNSTCLSYQVNAASCGIDYINQESCTSAKACPDFIRNLPTKINLASDCDTGTIMLVLGVIIIIVAFLILKGLF